MEHLIANCTFFEAANRLVGTQLMSSFLPASNVQTHHVDDDQQNDKSDKDAAASSSSTFAPKLFTIHGQAHCESISMSERKQRDVSGHCGARTLYVQQQTQNQQPQVKIMLRGANKFFDLSDAFASQSAASSFLNVNLDQSNNNNVIALRKAAGFFCMFFGEQKDQVEQKLFTLRCSSKHSLDSIHVDAAMAAMKQKLQNREGEFAEFLFSNNLVLLCECIHKNDENQQQQQQQQQHLGSHPTLDDDLFSSSSSTSIEVYCFALQLSNTVIEWSQPMSELRKVASRFGLPVVPEILLSNTRSLGDVVCQLVARATLTAAVSHDDDHHALRGEGAVLLIEGHHHQQQQQLPPTTKSVSRPIRLKVKTSSYLALRQLRSIVTEGNIGATTPLVAAMALWLLLQFNSNNNQQNQESAAAAAASSSSTTTRKQNRIQIDPQSKLPIGFSSWEHVATSFFSSSANTLLIKNNLNTDACSRYRAQLLCPRFLVIFSALPGSGKSTIAAAIRSEILKRESSTSTNKTSVHHIERDSFVPAIAQNSSTHAQRAARKAARIGFMKALRTPSEFVSNSSEILIADACHASVGARESTRVCASPFRVCVTLHIDAGSAPSDRVKLVKRIAKRQGHAVLRGAENAEKAIYEVSQAFVAPTQQDNNAGNGNVLIRVGIDESPERVASLVVDALWPEILAFNQLLLSCCNSASSSSSNIATSSSSSDDPWTTINSSVCTNTTNNITSMKLLLSLCSPPPLIQTVRLVPPPNASWNDLLLEPVLRTLNTQVLSSTSSSVLTSGSTQWITPYFSSKSPQGTQQQQQQQQQEFSAESIFASLSSSLSSSTEEEHQQLHVTLCHINDFQQQQQHGTKSKGIPNVDSWLRAEESHTVFSIRPTHVLLDRRCLAVRVEISSTTTNDHEHHQEFLHITLAHHVDKADAKHALRFAELMKQSGTRRERGGNNDDDDDGNDDDQEQEQEEEKKLSKRSKKKMMDNQFCIVPILQQQQPLELFGVVECLARR